MTIYPLIRSFTVHNKTRLSVILDTFFHQFFNNILKLNDCLISSISDQGSIEYEY